MGDPTLGDTLRMKTPDHHRFLIGIVNAVGISLILWMAAALVVRWWYGG